MHKIYECSDLQNTPLVASGEVLHLSSSRVEVAKVVPMPSAPELGLWLQAICHYVVLSEPLIPTEPEELLSMHEAAQNSSRGQDDTLLLVTSDAIRAVDHQTTFGYGGLAQQSPARHLVNL
jgi:hypothetical protein